MEILYFYNIILIKLFISSRVLTSIYPERTMQDDRSTQVLRLIDDAFVKICDMVYDGSVKVRSKVR